eukprot:GEMP01018524.1.p1 GENE.GEMP01018524.1~~GEMP01018524.1.p1  ORF type:complete len:567 (+),score=152.76 GEMP01018524.1:82-1782(+)
MGKALRRKEQKQKARVKKKQKKGDCIHGEKKGKKGIAANYISRAKALTKLQVSLADFRRLCILKGIYPRDPKKKPEGADKTYYHVKDITFLLHEPLLQKFFDMKSFMKRYKKVIGRHDKDSQPRMEAKRPVYTLDHLVRERYPSFPDAIADLDDALSTVAMFSSLHGDKRREIAPEVIAHCTKLLQEFMVYVIHKRCLRKVFVSIKGFYYAVDLDGHEVIWLMPHKFSQLLPLEVDFRVMLTFNEFYTTMVKFISFRLYKQHGWTYPPQRNSRAPEMAKFTLDLTMTAGELPDGMVEEQKKVDKAVLKDFGQEADEIKAMHKTAQERGTGKTFEGMKIFINRECPFHALYFVLRAGGAEVGWQMPESPLKIEDESITHVIVDKPLSALGELKAGREYVQPQWVFDSFNCAVMLPVGGYGVDKALPPHLSPFVNDEEEGYVPEQRKVLDSIMGTKRAEEVAEEEDEDMVLEKKEEEYNTDLKAEAEGKWASDNKENALAATAVKSVKKGVNKKAEERERAKALMPKKHKRLLHRIEYGENLKKQRAEKLSEKRDALVAKETPETKSQ